jgi:hypothetical protein
LTTTGCRTRFGDWPARVLAVLPDCGWRYRLRRVEPASGSVGAPSHCSGERHLAGKEPSLRKQYRMIARLLGKQVPRRRGCTPAVEVNLHRITFLRPARGVVLPAGGAIAHVDRSRVHTSETAALGGRLLAVFTVTARTLYSHEAFVGETYAASGCC